MLSRASLCRHQSEVYFKSTSARLLPSRSWWGWLSQAFFTPACDKTYDQCCWLRTGKRSSVYASAAMSCDCAKLCQRRWN
jgi:hypothetical protein